MEAAAEAWFDQADFGDECVVSHEKWVTLGKSAQRTVYMVPCDDEDRPSVARSLRLNFDGKAVVKATLDKKPIPLY